MKAIILSVIFAATTIVSFAQVAKPAQKGSRYGEKVSAKGALPVAMLAGKMGKEESLAATVTGKIVEVCEKKGCFMKMELANGESMMVRFKDYGFFVPTNLNGKSVVITGLAKQETLSVDDLKHYAEDAKKSEQEIAKITAPKKELTFEANGVLVL